MDKRSQPWLGNPLFESVFILAPAVVPVALVFFFQEYFLSTEVNTLWWIVLVLCIDVSHVYSTLFRLYWDRALFVKYKSLLITIPVIAFAFGFAVHLYDSMLFWRILAYVAVFHFVRQQYGFMRLYSRHEVHNKIFRAIDTIAIYTATVYPLLYWHISGTSKIAWFMKGDFVTMGQNILPLITPVYFFIIGVYIVKELIMTIRTKSFNIPRNLIVAGTFLSWYVGIVAFQADLIFTLLNVVAHGVPYMGLIWLFGEKKSTTTFKFNGRGVLIFAGVLILLAYVEENLWDRFVWNDHQHIFPVLAGNATANSTVLSLIVALLVLPQITHYVLDGFIWRFSKEKQ
jgi:hypothetical protein